MTEQDGQVKDDRRSENPCEKCGVSRWRGALIVLALCAMFGAVMGRTLEIQVERSADLTREARSQLTGGLEIHARRGAIYDRHGAEMAVSVLAESIFVRPDEVAAPREAAQALAGVLGLSEAGLVQEMSGPQRFRWLARRVAPHIAAQVRELAIPGIDSLSEWQRFYPMRTRAGQLMGFVGDDGYGLEGVELAYESMLAGGMMEVEGLRDAHGRPIIAQQSPNLQELEGSSIVLTIDATIQRIAERELERTILEQDARSGVAIVLDPHTGEILAMANWPPFDPNRFRSSHPADWRNRAVTDTWEPGSTFKPITYAAALEVGAIGPDTPIDCNGGRVRVGRYRVADAHRGTRVIPAWQVVQLSSNVGIFRIAQQVGQEPLYQLIRRFGFGQTTGTGFAGEQRGLVAEPPWAEIELANRAFGQGLTATPIQLALAYSAIANGGELMRPLLVREVRSIDGQVLQTFQPQVQRRVVSEQTAAQVIHALEQVVEAPGTGTRAAIPGIRVAGKTGTAQKVDPETSQYGELWMASFVGIVPADDPLFTIAVVIDEPQNDHYGGVVAAPVFARIAEQALATRAVFATRVDTDQVTSPGPAPDEIPAEQSPPRRQMAGLLSGPVAEGSDRTTVPDFTGYSLSEALLAAESTGLQPEVHGWGLVRHQWPAVGARVRRGSPIDLYLRAQYELTGEPMTMRSP